MSEEAVEDCNGAIADITFHPSDAEEDAGQSGLLFTLFS